jgi:hypothetical protein
MLLLVTTAVITSIVSDYRKEQVEMRFMKIIYTIMFLALGISQANAITFTFDDVPVGRAGLDDYQVQYGVGFSRGFTIVSHTGSSWGPPHSENNVLVWENPGGHSNGYGLMFKNSSGPIDAYSVGAYFSTEPGTVLEMVAYHNSVYETPVVSTTIGASGESWNNIFAEISSASGNIGIVVLRPVTTDALEHFCMDDLTINYVPEPSSTIALLGGLAGIGGMAWRRRRS